MWIAVNCVLLMLGAVLLVVGGSFYINNRETPGRTCLYILLYNVTAAVWCISYGLIGITDDLEVANFIRRFGIFAIDAFFINEIFFVSRMCRVRRSYVLLLRYSVLILSMIDFFAFSMEHVDIFVRIGNWTTWYSNPEFYLCRTIHSIYVIFVFITALFAGIIWLKNNTLKRQRKFIAMTFIANFILLFFCIPDTVLPLLKIYAVPTSGIGAAGCSLVMWYAATRLNSFDIQMGNIVGNLYEFIDAGVVVFNTDKKIAQANPFAKKLIPEENLNICGIDSLFEISPEEKNEVFTASLSGIYFVKLQGNDGRSYSIRINAVNDDYGEPYCFLCVFMDVTEETGGCRTKNGVTAPFSCEKHKSQTTKSPAFAVKYIYATK